MCGPAGSARDREDRREQVGRNAERVVHGGGVEIDVRVEVLFAQHDLGDALAHVEPLGFAELGAELLGHALQVRRAGVEHLVNAVADAHDFLFVLQAAGDEVVHLVEVADLLEHLDDALVGSAVQRPLERADGGGDGRVHAAERGDGDARREGRGVHAVVGVQDVAHVDGLFLFLNRFFAVDEIEEVRRLTEGRVGIGQRLALPGQVEIGGDDRHLCDQLNGTLGLHFHRILPLGRFVAGEGGNQGANGTHR